MIVEEFYKKITTDYQDVIGRLANKRIIDRIIVKLKEDEISNNLQEIMQQKKLKRSISLRTYFKRNKY